MWLRRGSNNFLCSGARRRSSSFRIRHGRLLSRICPSIKISRDSPPSSFLPSWPQPPSTDSRVPDNYITMTLPSDPTTQTNWQDVASEHVDFDWAVDFNKQTLSGSVTHTLVWKKADVREVMYVSTSTYIGEFTLIYTGALVSTPNIWTSRRSS